MNKELAKQGSTLTKNMTATENLSLDNLTTKNILLPIYLTPATAAIPEKGML